MLWGVIVLVLIVMFPRAFLFIIGTVILGVAILVSGAKEQRRASQEIENRVRLEISYDVEHCGPSQPLLLTITNASKKNLYYTEFSVLGFRAQHSEPLYRKHHETDRIVEAGEKVLECWGVPEPLPEKKGLASGIPEQEIIWRARRDAVFMR